MTALDLGRIYPILDTQVKERLTGAVILVALVVLLVPELLTGPGRAAPAVQARPDEPAMRSYTIDLAEGGVRQRAVPVALETAEPVPHVAAASVPAKVASMKVASIEESPRMEPTPPTPPPAQAVPSEPPPVTGWSIQLGSFVSRENAQRLVRELKAKGFTAFILEGGGTSGKLYRVRVGPATDRAAAAALATTLREAGQPGSIVPHP